MGVQGALARFVIVLLGCIWNAPTVSLVLPAFDDTGSLGFPPRRVFYRPSISTLVTASRFLADNRKSKSEEKVVGFSSASLFAARKRESVSQGGIMEIGGYNTGRGGEPREPVLPKAGRTNETAGAFQIRSRRTKITQARVP